MSGAEPTRPALRWHGGKWLLAPWIIAHMPPHRVYVEPFGGGGSVLLRKPRAYAEIYNDLDGEVVNYFRVLRDPGRARALIEAISLTPFARAEFKDAYEPSDDAVERARRLLIRCFMGFGSNAHNVAWSTAFTAKPKNRFGTTPAQDWATLPDAMAALVARLQGVVIEQRPALEIIDRHDGRDTLFYFDPPYVHATRKRAGKGYVHEMSDADHADLLQRAREIGGMVLISGYRCDLYDERLGRWARIDRIAYAHGARPRVESLWLSPRAAAAIERQPMLFGAVEL